MSRGVIDSGEARFERPNQRRVVLRWRIEEWDSTGKVISLVTEEMDETHLRKHVQHVWLPLPMLREILKRESAGGDDE